MQKKKKLDSLLKKYLINNFHISLICLEEWVLPSVDIKV